MIVKFDHISFIAERGCKDSLLSGSGEPVFEEINLKNISIKEDLMRRPQPDHDLYFYDDDIPVEYIFYDEVVEQGKIKIQDGKIYGLCNDLIIAGEYLKSLFGEKSVCTRENEIICSMKGILDKKEYILVLESSSEDVFPYLDDGGYGVIALIVNKDYDASVDWIITDQERVTVNSRDLDIRFMRSASTNVIFELIRVNGLKS